MSIGDWIGEHWNNFRNGLLNLGFNQGQYAKDLFNIAFSAGDEDAKTRAINAWNTTLNFGQQQAGSAGGVASPVFDLPVVKQLGAGLTWLQKTAVNRPLSTAALVSATGNDEGFDAVLNPDTWQKAWDDSRKVTAGQAMTYNLMEQLGQIDPHDESLDPRKSKDAYAHDWFYRTTSGGMDFFLTLADPLRGVGKLAALGKLRLYDKALTAKQVAQGGLEKQVFGNKEATAGMTFHEAGGQLGRGEAALMRQAQNMDADTFVRLYTNQYAYGGTVGTALHAAANSGRADAAEVFGDVLLSARGSYAATRRLTNTPGGMALADAIGRQRNPWNLANITARQVDDPFAAERADAQAESAMASVQDQMALSSPTGTPQYGTLQGTRGGLFDRGTPKVRPRIDALRVGIHRFQNDSYLPLQTMSLHQRVIVRGLGSVARVASPARGYAAHLDVNDPASFRQFRANLERAGDHMPDDVRNRYVTAYMSALTAPERARIAGIADNYVIGHMAQAHGMTLADAERLIRDASIRRQSFRQMLNGQQKFLPDVFVRKANELLRNNAREEASRLQDYADDYRARVISGELPGAVMVSSDDMGRPIFIIDDDWQNPLTVDRMGRMATVPRIAASDPLLVSQTADRLPMVDYQRFERALSRFAEPRSRIERYESDQQRIAAGLEPEYNVTEAQYKRAKRDRAVSAATGVVGDVYEALEHVWSVAAVLRPAQMLRNLGDEGTRSLTMMGILPTILAGTRGIARVAYNRTRDGYTWAQQRQLLGARRAIEGRTHEQVAVDDVGAPPTVTPSESSGYYNYIDPQGTSGALTIGADEVYPTIEAALTNGRIDLETYIAYLPWAQRQGRLPFDLNAIVEDWAHGFYGQGITGRRGLRREVLEYLHDNLGTLAFTHPRWQSDAADAINQMIAGQRRFRENSGVILNPLNDEASYILDSRLEKNYEHVAHRYLYRNPETNELDDLDGIYDFAADHAEKLLFGNYKLHAKPTGDFRVRLSIVRDTGAPRPIGERMTAEQRKAALRGLKGPGSAGTLLVDGTRSVTLPNVFTGMFGDYIKSAAASQHVPRAIVKAQRMADRAWQWNRRVDRGDVTSHVLDAEGRSMPNPDWDDAWKEMADIHLANDEAARRLLQGQSESQVLAWLDSTDPSALRYLNDKPLGLAVDDHVSSVRALVDYLAPPSAGQGLRDKILNHEATGADIKAVVHPNHLPTVSGEVTTATLGSHPVQQWVKRNLDRWFRVMQDKPVDFLVRYPFIENRYKGYFNPLVENYMRQVPGHLITQEEINNLQRMAGAKALDDTRRFLYDQTFRTDFANLISPLVPFSNAIADAFFSWARIARAKPFDTLANWNLVYNAPERMGLVYDQDGNSLSWEGGKAVWISKLDGSVMPDKVKHDKYVAFQPPSWIANKIPGGLKLVTFNKNSMTSAIFDPSINVAPLVALPINQFALYHPEVGESQFVKTYVLPFGPTPDVGKAVLPGLIRAAYNWYREDESKASSAAMAIYQTQMTDFQLGKRASLPNLEEAKSQARDEQFLRFMTSANSPISFQYNTPYKPFVDLYSQLLRKYKGDDAKAMDEFRQTAGDDYIYLAARVTKANIALPATMAGYKAFKNKQAEIQKYPELSSLITGEEGAGSFAKSVYEWEKKQTYDETGKPIREEMTIADSVKDLQRRVGWSDWVKYNAQITNDLARRGLHSINATGAEDIKQRYAYWITARKYIPGPNGELEVSPWYEDFRSTDDAKMENRLVQMQQILMDNPSWLPGRDDLQGLARFLDMRRQMKNRMDQLGYATLDSQKASWLQDVWEAQVNDLRRQNVAFDQLYARWLSRDNLGAQGLAANEIVAALEGPNAENTAPQ